MTGRAISPLTAAALCVKPRGQMTARQVANVDALKAASAEFTAMRHLAMRFRGLLRSGTPRRLDAWLIDARASGIYAMQRFARTIRKDLEAVRNAVLEPWSSGQTEGQINKLKTLKRAMFRRPCLLDWTQLARGVGRQKALPCELSGPVPSRGLSALIGSFSFSR
jgi:transposase